MKKSVGKLSAIVLSIVMVATALAVATNMNIGNPNQGSTPTSAGSPGGPGPLQTPIVTIHDDTSYPFGDPNSVQIRLPRDNVQEVIEAEDTTQCTYGGDVDLPYIWLWDHTYSLSWVQCTSSNATYEVYIQFPYSDTNDGIAEVRVDGTILAYIDTYKRDWWYLEISDLPYSTHTVRVSTLYSNSPAPGGTILSPHHATARPGDIHVDFLGFGAMPIADANGPYVGDEGSPIIFNGSASTEPYGNPLEYRWDFENDGTWDTPWMDGPLVQYTWLDDYTGTVALEVTNGTATDTDTADVTVNNVAPTVEAGEPQEIDEGGGVFLIGSFEDPGILDSWDCDWDFELADPFSWSWTGTGNLLTNGDFSNGLTGWSTSIEAPATTTIQVIPYDESRYYVLDINNPDSDGDGDWDFAYQTINLDVVFYSSLYFAADGKAIYQSLSDDGWVGGEYPVHFSIRYRDINGDWHNGLLSSNPWQQGFYYKGTGQYPYSNKVDQNVWFHYKSGNLMELDPKPAFIETVRVGASGWAYHGRIDNVFLYGFQNAFGAANYGDNGNFTATLTVTDDDGGVGNDSTYIIVNNVDPSLSSPFGPFYGDEGSPITFTATASDPGSDDLTFTWDVDYCPTFSYTHFNDGSGPDPFPSPGPIYPFWATDIGDCTLSDNGIYNVLLTVDDDDLGTTNMSTTVVVENANPTIAEPFGPFTGVEGSPISFTATATDPGSDDLTFTWSIEYCPVFSTTYFNDNSGPDPFPSPWGTFPYTATDTVECTLGDNGVYTVSLMVNDDDGGVVYKNTTVIVENVDPVIDDLTAYTYANITLRIAGEKWHDVGLYLYEDGVIIGFVSVVRMPGNPDEQTVALSNVKIELTHEYSVKVLYTPDNDPINGQPKGATPAWLIITHEDGSETWLHHTFNVNHEETWEWDVDINMFFVGDELTFEAWMSDVGSDDLSYVLSFGDLTSDESGIFYNDNANPDPYPSPWGTYPFSAFYTTTHTYTVSGDYIVTLTVTDDDSGTTSTTITIKLS